MNERRPGRVPETHQVSGVARAAEQTGHPDGTVRSGQTPSLMA